MHTMAEGLAQTATNLLSESVELQNPTFEIVNTEMQAPLQNPLLAIMDKLGVIAHDAPPYGEDYPEPVTAYHFGPLTVATAPGEVVPTIGLELRDIMDGDYKMIVNLGEDWIGYLLTPQEFFDLFVYAEDSMVCAGPAVGKALVATYQQLFAPR
jgi:hypothetical protein